MRGYPFPFLFHGTVDPHSLPRSAECIVCFEKAPPLLARREIGSGIPKPLGIQPPSFDGNAMLVESDGDSFDGSIAKDIRTGPTHDDVARFQKELEAWLRAMHAVHPIGFVVGPLRPEGWTAWREWSEGAGLDRVVTSLAAAGLKPKGRLGRAIRDALDDLDDDVTQAMRGALAGALAGRTPKLPARKAPPATKTPPKAASKIARLGRGGRLDLSEMRLKQLPDEVRALKQLTQLWIWENQMTELPEWIGELRNLRELNASDNRFRSLPASLALLPKLAQIDLANCPELKDDGVLARCRSVRELNLHGTPAPLGVPLSLEKLSLGEASMQELPAWVCDLERLEILQIQDAPRLTRLPPSIRKLRSLKEVWIDGCGLRELPPEIADLPLRVLHASRCKLTTLPPELAKMKTLRELDLSGNRVPNWPRGGEERAASKALAALFPKK